MTKEVATRNHPWLFFGVAVLLWAILDIVLSYNLNFTLYQQAFWLSLVFYILYPLLFVYLYYYLLWDVTRGFLLMVALMFVIEGLLFDNYQIYSFPDLFLYIPLGLCVYGLITIVPLWIAEGQARYHIGPIAVFLIGAVLLGLVNFF